MDKKYKELMEKGQYSNAESYCAMIIKTKLLEFCTKYNRIDRMSKKTVELLLNSLSSIPDKIYKKMITDIDNQDDYSFVMAVSNYLYSIFILLDIAIDYSEIAEVLINAIKTFIVIS